MGTRGPRVAAFSRYFDRRGPAHALVLVCLLVALSAAPWGRSGGGAAAAAQPAAPAKRRCTKVVVSDDLARLKKNAAEGKPCGAGVAVCQPGLCCAQNGHCSKSAVACDGTCQCAYSGAKSGCAGAFPLQPPVPTKLPVAAAGGACGAFVAKCGGTQCCSLFGICTDNENYCRSPSCVLAASPKSKLCKAAHKAFPTGRVVRKYEVNATIGPYSPDGNITRDMILTNGQFGNFLIEANAGERIVVVYNNRMPVTSSDGMNMGSSIHWHGMLQSNSNQEDGFAIGSQRPVAFGESFVYSFIADTPGTFWWHSHHHAEYIDGLRGLLIVQEPANVGVNVTSDFPLVLADFYSAPWSALVSYYMSPDSNGEEPTPRNGLINGISQDGCLQADYTKCKYPKFKATPGTCNKPQTRMRIVNSGGFAVFQVSVDAHRMVVVALDGVPVEPITVDYVSINNGQRYDVLLCRIDGSLDNSPAWIRVDMPDETFVEAATFNRTFGILYYTKDPPSPADLPPPLVLLGAAPPKANPSSVAPPPARGGSPVLLSDRKPSDPDAVIRPSDLVAFHGSGPPLVPPSATMTMALTLEFEVPPNANGTQYAYFGNVSLEQTGKASLLERLYGNPEGEALPATPSGAVPAQGWDIRNVSTPGAVVDIIINNHDEGEHPLHLHGHWFWLMARGEEGAGDYVPGTPYNLGRVARDTTTVEGSSYLILRFIANNPGFWPFHCHIDWHFAAGLGFVVRELI